MDLTKADTPLSFLFFATLGVVAMMAILSWLFASLGWPGPLSLIKGGYAHG